MTDPGSLLLRLIDRLPGIDPDTNLPWLVPVLLVVSAAGMLLSRPIDTALRTTRALAVALVVSLGLIVGATLTPLRGSGAPGFGNLGGCDLSRISILSLDELARFGDPTLNILLFLPLGIVLGLLPAGSRQGPLLVAAIVLPFAIELTQSFAAPLGRGCQSGDVIDNLTGLILGLAAGLALRWIAARRKRAAGGETASS